MGRPRKGQKQKCQKCGTVEPSRFRDRRYLTCKQCRNTRDRELYHEQAARDGRTTRRSGPRKPNDWTPAEIEAAAKFGLTVPQYREARRDA